VDRRTFLSGLAAVAVATACADDDSDRSASGSSGNTDIVAAEPAAADLPAGSFSLGVASGDPLADRVMLWTRLASAPTTVGGGSPDTDVEVAYDVATDDQFTRLVASGVVTATSALAHSVHVDVTNLSPDTWYHYRFRAGDQTSPVGRTRTFPAPSANASRFRFVFASCQDYQWGHYGAWAHAGTEPDLDAVVFLGDYIYETTLGDLSPARSGARVWAAGEAQSLEDYRGRYAQTKSDPQLQAAHQAVPWLTVFDDHEVSNNYAGDVGQGDIARPLSHNRRLAAYQAWYEHTPIRIDPAPSAFDSLTVNRSLTFGTLATLFGIETRQHADPPPCRTGVELTDDAPGCAERDDPARTNLGSVQEQWLRDQLTASTSTWNVIANPLLMAGLNTGTVEEPKFTLDTWDGYPAARDRLLSHIETSKISNPVVVTGDWHASFVLDVKRTPDAPTLMPEFLASSMTTLIFGDDFRAANPHVRYFVGEHGYGLVTITPEQLLCEFKYITDVWDPNTAISHVDGWKVLAGEHEAQPV